MLTWSVPKVVYGMVSIHAGIHAHICAAFVLHALMGLLNCSLKKPASRAKASGHEGFLQRLAGTDACPVCQGGHPRGRRTAEEGVWRRQVTGCSMH